MSVLASTIQNRQLYIILSVEFEDDGRYNDIKNLVATTWLVSFKQIRDRDGLAANYLSFKACINPKDIPQSLLLAGTSRKTEMEATRMLEAYSFIFKRPADLALDLHRLVHFDRWTAEEIGLVGAAYYVSQLTQAEKGKQRLVLCYNMMASPNFACQIYDSD